MAARQVLYVVIESSYGTAKASPVLGTDAFYMRLDQDNAFTMEAIPIQLPIMYGGGQMIEADTVADIVECKGNFSFNLYPGIFSSVLLNWAYNPVNAGRTAPWVTTDASGVMPIGDLASLSFYHAYLQEDGTTMKRTRYAGCKCDSIQVMASETGDGRVWKLSGSIVGIRPVGNAWDSSSDPVAAEFPAKAGESGYAETNYPFSPYTLGHLGSGTGTVTVGTAGGTNRAASLVSCSIKTDNILSPNYYTSRFNQTNLFVGRNTTCDLVLRYKGTPDDRATYRALSAITTTIKIDNGTNTVQWAMNASNVIRPWSRQLPNGGQYLQGMTIQNRFSASAAGDITVTTT